VIDPDGRREAASLLDLLAERVVILATGMKTNSSWFRPARLTKSERHREYAQAMVEIRRIREIIGSLPEGES